MLSWGPRRVDQAHKNPSILRHRYRFLLWSRRSLQIIAHKGSFLFILCFFRFRFLEYYLQSVYVQCIKPIKSHKIRVSSPFLRCQFCIVLSLFWEIFKIYCSDSRLVRLLHRPSWRIHWLGFWRYHLVLMWFDYFLLCFKYFIFMCCMYASICSWMDVCTCPTYHMAWLGLRLFWSRSISFWIWSYRKISVLSQKASDLDVLGGVLNAF